MTTHLVTRVRVLGGKRIADHVADVVRDEVGFLDLQRVHHGGDVASLRLLVVAAFGMRRETHAAEIGNDHRMIASERRRDRRPHVAGVAKAVQKDDGGPVAAGAEVDRRAVRRDVLQAKVCRKLVHDMTFRG